MKTKLVLIIIGLAGSLLLFAGGPYRITKIKPNKKILIGNKKCGKGDIFYQNQTVHWDKNEAFQAFEADDINNPSITIAMSKGMVRKKTSANISYKTLCALVGKGEDDYMLLWPDDSIKLSLQIDTTYRYRLHIEGTNEYKEVPIIDGAIVIAPKIFGELFGIIKFSIVRIKKWDIENVKYYEVELVK